MSALESIERAQRAASRSCYRMRVASQDFDDVRQDAAVDVLRYGNGNARLHAHRATVAHLRREMATRVLVVHLEEWADVFPRTPELDTDAVDVRMLLDGTSMSDREVFVLRLMGYRLSEIGESFDASESWASVALRRITREMREQLEA